MCVFIYIYKCLDIYTPINILKKLHVYVCMYTQICYSVAGFCASASPPVAVPGRAAEAHASVDQGPSADVHLQPTWTVMQGNLGKS